MASLRRSNRAPKRKVYWEPPIDLPRKRQPPPFTIHTDPPEDLSTQKGLSNYLSQLPDNSLSQLPDDSLSQLPDDSLSQLPDDSLSQLPDDGLSQLPDDGLSPQLLDEDLSDALSTQLLDKDLSDALSTQLYDEDLSDALSTQLYDEDLSDYLSDYLSQLSDDSLSQLSDEDLSNSLSQLPDDSLSQALSIQLSDKDLSNVLSAQLHEGLDMDPPYQPQFLPKDRVGKPQNLPEDPTPIKLFQLFFTIEEIKNIVKQTNQQAVYIDFKYPWKSLTVTEAYHYLGCLVYIGVQPLRELDDHWHLKTPIASCFSQQQFKQIRHAITIRDPNTSPEQPKDP